MAFIQLPNGAFFPMEEGETADQAWAAARQKYPEAFGAQMPGAPVSTEQPEGGFTAAAKAGTQRLIGQGALAAGKVGLMDPKAAEAFNAERQQRAQQIFKPTEESFVDAPWQNIKELAGGSAPYMAAPLVAAGAAALGGAPAAVGAGLAGATSAAQFFGGNLDRSMQENKTSLENTSGVAAATAAIPQAALDIIGFKFIPGIGKLFGAAGQKITAETAKEMAAQTAKQIALEYAKRTGQAMTAEGVTETMQQVLERAQAGISTVSPEARGEYLQSFFGGAILAGGLAPAGTFIERGSAKSQSQRMAQEEEGKKRAAAEKQRKEYEASPEYLLSVGDKYDAAQQRLKELKSAVRPKQPKNPTPEQELEYEAALSAYEEQKNNNRAAQEEYRAARDAYKAVAPAVQKLREERRVAGLTPQEYALENTQEVPVTAAGVSTTPLTSGDEELGFVSPAKPGYEAGRYAAEQLSLAQEREPYPSTSKYVEYLMAQPELARAVVKQRPELPGLSPAAQRSVLDTLSSALRLRDEAIAKRNKAENMSAFADRDSLMRQQRLAEDADPLAGLLREGLDEAANARSEGRTRRDIERTEQQAAGVNEMVKQPRLFGEPEEVARVGTGTAGSTRSEAQILADIEIARSTTSGPARRGVLAPLVEELRALRDATKARDTNAKAGPQGVDIRSRDLEQPAWLGYQEDENGKVLRPAGNMQVPEETARRQSLTDARYRSFGQMVSTLDRFNRGLADRATMKQAEQGVIDNLVREIESITGTPLSTMERQSVMAEARELLFDLKSRFGDTRAEVNTGTRKEPQWEPVQEWGGAFRTDLPAEGAGPTGMGLENFETEKSSRRTFSNRYAAAQSILEGLDQIRNRRAGTQTTAPGVDRTDSARDIGKRFDDAARRASSAEGQDAAVVQGLQANRDALLNAQATEGGPLPQRSRMERVPQRAAETAIEYMTRLANGQDVTDLRRELQDVLALQEQGKRSETEGGKTAVQTELFGTRGALFTSFKEFEDFLAGDALDRIKKAQGQTRETLARAVKMVAPLQKRAAELEAQVKKLVAQRDAWAKAGAEEDAASRKKVLDAEAQLAQAQEDMEYAVSDYRQALQAAQQKLQDALVEDARIASQIADNMAALEAPVQAARADQTALIGASRKLADAKEALAKYAPTLFSSVDPISRPKLAEYVRLERAIDSAQVALVKASDKARASTVGAFQPDRVAAFQQTANELSLQRKQQLRRIAGLTGARNRAQRSLDAAIVVAQADPELVSRLANAQEMVALAASLRKDSMRGVESVNAEARALEVQMSDVSAPLPALRRQIADRLKEAQGKPPAVGEKETQLDREAKDGERRREEQARLELFQEGTVPREAVSFEPRRLDQESLDEASTRMAALEDILARVPMNEEQRAVFEEAAAEYKTRSDALEKKAKARLENVEGKLAAQRKRIEMLQRAQAEYDAADVDSPQRARAQDRVARLQDQLKTQGAKISKAWGIRREAIVSQAERRARADQTLRETQGKPVSAADEQLTEGQTKRRTSSPATRVTRQTGGFRTGNAETVAERAGAQRQRIEESQRPKERDTPVSRAEQQAANADAERMQEEAKRANAEAARMKKGTPPKRRKQVEGAKDVGQTILQAMDEKTRGPKTRTQSAIEEMDEFDFEGDTDTDGLLREDASFYSDREKHPLSEEAADAVLDGRPLDVLKDIATNGSTPFTRRVGARLLEVLSKGRVPKLRNQEMLRVNGVRAEGVFYPQRNEVVIDNFAMNEEVVVHEFSHAATLRAIAGDVPLDASQQQALADLKALYETMQRDPDFETEYAGKDLAEFVSELLSNQNVRDKIDAAQGRGFLDRLYDGLLRLLGIRASDKAVDDAFKLFAPSRSFEYNMRAVPSIMRGVFPGTAPRYASDISASVQTATERTVGRDPTLADKIFANVAGFRAQFIDRFDSWEKLIRQGVSRGMINDVQAAQFSMFMRQGEQRSAFVNAAATDSVAQLVKTADGDFMFETPEGDHPNLLKIAEALSRADAGNEAATERLFTSYLAVLRGEQVGFDKLNFETPLTPAEVQDIKDAVNATPQRKEAFESARKMYREYNNQLLDLVVQSGAMPKAKAAALKRGDYVPYYRQDPDGLVSLIVAGETPVRIGNIKDQPYLAELVGGNDKILPFFTGAMQNTEALIGMALRNKQVMEMSYMVAKSLQLGRIRSGTAPANGDGINFMIDGDQVHLHIENAVKDWGVPAELLVKGLEGIKTTLPAGLRLMQIPANLLRTMVTRAPAYAVRQIIREPINAWLGSGGNFTPVVSSVKELTKIRGGTSTGARALERAGMISSNIITGDKQDQARILRDIAQGKSAWHKVMMEADKFAMQGDTATRAVLYDTFRKQGMTHMQAALGALESMNFARRGLSPTMQMMSMLVPFFNAQVQGLDVIYRAAMGKTTFEQKLDVQRKLLTRGAMMMAGTLAYAAMMQDDEAYKNATPVERAQNWFLPLPGFDEPLRIPIPFELGFAFKALPELMLNVAVGDTQTSDAVKAMGTLAFQSLPIGMPQAIKPAVEVMTNYSFYTGDSVEGQRERLVQKGERFRDNTTELAKLLGKAEVLSPVQIDYLMRGYTGGLGLTLVGLTNNVWKLANPAEDLAEGATKKASQTPLIGALFQPTDGRGVIDEAYKDIESWQQASQTYKRMLEQGRRGDAQKFAQDFSMQIALNATGGAFKQQMGELATIRRAVLASKDLTPDQKRAQVDQIRQVELALSRQIREAQRRAGG